MSISQAAVDDCWSAMQPQGHVEAGHRATPVPGLGAPTGGPAEGDVPTPRVGPTSLNADTGGMVLSHGPRVDAGHASRLRRLAAPAVVGASVLALTAYVAAVDPNQSGHYPLCPTYALAGIYCPGCGMLRATHDLAHGDLAGAMERNPLAPFLLAGLVAWFGLWVLARWTGRPVHWTPGRWTPWLLATGLLLFTVARNVPGWTWLSPA